MPEDIEWIQEQARLREATLHSAFEQFASPWPYTDKADCFLNRGLLLMACESYFRDIWRRKDFHGIHVADSHKRAGYAVKWLMRFRPIQYQSNYISDRVAFANEMFSLWVACEHLTVDIGHIPGGVVEHVAYHFRFRPFDPDAWAMSFYLLQRCSERGVLAELGQS